MVLSHEHEFIFLHCRKTGGSTVKSYLNPYLGPRDIQLGAWSDAFMNGGGANRRLIYDCVQCLALKPVRSLRIALNVSRPVFSPATRSREESIPKLLNRLQKARYHYRNPGHPMATEVKQDFPEEWKRYRTFCFVRNPFEKAVSDYLWRKRVSGAEEVSFREFVERVANPTRRDPEGIVPFPRTNWPIYTIDDNVAVDFTGRHENFVGDLRCALQEVGVPFVEENLPKAKDSKSYDYRTFYEKHTLELVERVYHKEIRQFGYTFENTDAK